MSAPDAGAALWERLLLGAVAQSPQRSAEAWPGFDAAHIAAPELRQAWRLLAPRGEPIPALELAARLGLAEDALAALLPMVPAPVDVGEVSKRVSACHVLREAAACARRSGAAGAVPGDGDWDAATGLVRREAARWRALLDGLPDGGPPAHGASVARWLRALGRRAAAPGEAWVPTGFGRLDALTGGLRPGHLVYVAGRPGMGKTFLLLALSRAALLAGRPVVFVSLEMLEGELVERMAAADAGVGLARLRQAALSEAECRRLDASARRQARWPMAIVCPRGTGCDEVVDQARRAADGLDRPLICLDYVQLVSVPGAGGATRNEQLERVSRALKVLAREAGGPVVAASQLSREVERRADKRPLMSDLRDSGSLEADADHVWMLYRPGRYDRAADPAAAEIILEKNRHGEAGGTVRARFDEATGRFAQAPGDAREAPPPAPDAA